MIDKVRKDKKFFADAVTELIAKHYDRQRKVWLDEDGDTCSKEETEAYQSQLRELRFQVQMMEEEEQVGAFGNTKFWPLVSRRMHPELWEVIGKTKQDGNLFIFKPLVEHKVIRCGCTDDELESVIDTGNWTLEQMTGFTSNELITRDIALLRQQHNLRLEKIHNTGTECPNPIEEYVSEHQNKHTIGNWNCKACLNLGREIASADDANAALGDSTKALEWCPRFISNLRGQAMAHYLSMVTQPKSGGNRCYAGLLHSEMSFEEAEFHTPENPLYEKKTYVVITKKCDTCDYSSVEQKEYYQPAPVENDDLLMAVPQAIELLEHKPDKELNIILTEAVKLNEESDK